MRGQGREQRGTELIKEVFMNSNDEEEKTILMNCCCPHCLEFAVAPVPVVMVLLVEPAPHLCCSCRSGYYSNFSDRDPSDE